MKPWILFALLSFQGFLPFAYAENVNADPSLQLKELQNKNSQLQGELENLKLDRNNILKQAQSFQKEKEDILSKMEATKNNSASAATELESLKKESALLNAELEKLRQARAKDRELYTEEKGTVERKLKEEEDKNLSLAKTLEEYTPEKISQVVEDRNRLDVENKQLAQKILDQNQKLEEVQRNMTPLELDREELHKTVAENKELRDRTKYIQKVEDRLEQLIKENKEYREQLEVMKAKFKDSVPGLAKSGRIAQKMMRENAQMHYNLGTIFLQNKRYKESITEYEKALELMPNDPDTHYNLGVLYDDFMKDRNKALYHYQKYIAVNPKAPDAKKVENYMLSLELEEKVR